MATMEPTLGAIVQVQLGRGVVRFVGATSFQVGKWVGIELDEAQGKNDGSVQGIPYFTCEPNHGVFVRPSQIKAVLGSERVLTRPPSSSSSVQVSRDNLDYQQRLTATATTTNTNDSRTTRASAWLKYLKCEPASSQFTASPSSATGHTPALSLGCLDAIGEPSNTGTCRCRKNEHGPSASTISNEACIYVTSSDPKGAYSDSKEVPLVAAALSRNAGSTVKSCEHIHAAADCYTSQHKHLQTTVFASSPTS
jgi:CAP-Gly domain